MSINEVIDSLKDQDYSLDFSVPVSRKMYEHTDARSYFTERAVFEVLELYGAKPITDFSHLGNGYSWVRNDRGVIVYDGKDQVHEFDEVLSIDDVPVLVEVKASKLDGFSEKIPRALEIADKSFGEGVARLLVFFPHRYNSQSAIAKVDESPYVSGIDTGWSKKELNRLR